MPYNCHIMGAASGPFVDHVIREGFELTKRGRFINIVFGSSGYANFYMLYCCTLQKVESHTMYLARTFCTVVQYVVSVQWQIYFKT